MGKLQDWGDKLDMFGTSVYTYNFEGRNNVHSLMGVFCSIFVRCFALFFLYQKTLVSYRGDSPIVTFYEE
jgi:hypothetical protein